MTKSYFLESALKSIIGINFNAFIIDDEGDQASLNTKKDKEKEDLISKYLEGLDDELTKNSSKEEKTSIIVLNTIKGKGVSFMENKASWHGVAPSREQCEQALSELEGE